MKDISYHILDIVQNSLQAGAEKITIDLTSDSNTGVMILKIIDNGRGMSTEVLEKAIDPFYTSSLKKKVGLGLPLLRQNAELTGGSFSIESVELQGTRVTAVFNYNHIDMIPMGDLGSTFRTLIAANPSKDFILTQVVDGKEFIMDTSEIRNELGEISIDSKEILDFIAAMIREQQEAFTNN